MPRIRHCLECPKCFTRYVISLSPYRNGAHVLSTLNQHGDEYILFCSCGKSSSPTRWKRMEVMLCRVSKEAFERGYGSAADVVRMHEEDGPWTIDASQYLDHWKLLESRKNS